MGVALAAYEALEEKGTCLRTDCYKPPFLGNNDEGAFRVFGPDHAEMIGANAVMNMLYTHHSHEKEMFIETGELIGESLEIEVPVILEALPFGIGRPDDYTPENIGFCVRAAAELGADVVKTAFPTNGSVADFKKIVDACLSRWSFSVELPWETTGLCSGWCEKPWMREPPELPWAATCGNMTIRSGSPPRSTRLFTETTRWIRR